MPLLNGKKNNTDVTGGHIEVTISTWSAYTSVMVYSALLQSKQIS
jgi:hypothetical protein